MDNAIIEYYNSYDEAGRLFRNYSHQIEWLTTIHYFDKLIPPASTIFDGCAGTGNYAFRLAKQGHHVAASDIVPHNVDIMREEQQKNSILFVRYSNFRWLIEKLAVKFWLNSELFFLLCGFLGVLF